MGCIVGLPSCSWVDWQAFGASHSGCRALPIRVHELVEMDGGSCGADCPRSVQLDLARYALRRDAQISWQRRHVKSADSPAAAIRRSYGKCRNPLCSITRDTVGPCTLRRTFTM